MVNLKKAIVAPSLAVMTLMGVVALDVPAFAQDASVSVGGVARRPLTVRRRPRGSEVTPYTGLRGPHPGPVTAPTAPGVAAAPGAVVAPVSGAASTIVGLPFQALGGIFPAGGPRKGGVTNVMYVGAGKEQSKIDEGWAEPVPVDMSGPIFVVENGDPTISPLSLIGAPIAAAGQIAQSPFKILGAAGL